MNSHKHVVTEEKADETNSSISIPKPSKLETIIDSSSSGDAETASGGLDGGSYINASCELVKRITYLESLLNEEKRNGYAWYLEAKIPKKGFTWYRRNLDIVRDSESVLDLDAPRHHELRGSPFDRDGVDASTGLFREAGRVYLSQLNEEEQRMIKREAYAQALNELNGPLKDAERMSELCDELLTSMNDVAHKYRKLKKGLKK